MSIPRDEYLYIYSSDLLDIGLERLRDQIARAVEDVATVTTCETTDTGWHIDLAYDGIAIGNFVLIEAAKCLKQYGCTRLTTLDNGRHRHTLPDWLAKLGVG
jgi:hypothetical protein